MNAHQRLQVGRKRQRQQLEEELPPTRRTRMGDITQMATESSELQLRSLVRNLKISLHTIMAKIMISRLVENILPSTARLFEETINPTLSFFITDYFPEGEIMYLHPQCCLNHIQKAIDIFEQSYLLPDTWKIQAEHHGFTFTRQSS